MAVTLLLHDQWAELSLPADPGRVFHPVRRPEMFIYNTNVCVLHDEGVFCVDTHWFHSLKSISGPCSIEKVYPREWRIASPASLMQVEYI